MMMHDDSAIVEQNLAPRAIFLKDTARGAVLGGEQKQLCFLCLSFGSCGFK